MPKSLLYSCVLFFFLLGFQVEAQSVVKKPFFKGVTYKTNVKLPLNENEKNQLQEVYSIQLQELVLSNSQRLKDIKNILRNRVDVKRIPNFPKQTKLLSKVPLFNKYNEKLRRKRFKVESFNPLKYQFNFFANGTEMYRVDKTDYYIIIKSQFQK